MKITAFILVLVLLVVPLAGCGDYEVYYGKSEIYDRKDIDKAVDEVMDEFRSWRGCKMISLSYAGDERCIKESESYSRNSKYVYEEYIVITSTFRSPLDGGACWNANTIYEGWSWILGRNNCGRWELITSGYA